MPGSKPSAPVPSTPHPTPPRCGVGPPHLPRGPAGHARQAGQAGRSCRPAPSLVGSRSSRPASAHPGSKLFVLGSLLMWHCSPELAQQLRGEMGQRAPLPSQHCSPNALASQGELLAPGRAHPEHKCAAAPAGLHRQSAAQPGGPGACPPSRRPLRLLVGAPPAQPACS